MTSLADLQIRARSCRPSSQYIVNECRRCRGLEGLNPDSPLLWSEDRAYSVLLLEVLWFLLVFDVLPDLVMEVLTIAPQSDVDE